MPRVFPGKGKGTLKGFESIAEVPLVNFHPFFFSWNLTVWPEVSRSL